MRSALISANASRCLLHSLSRDRDTLVAAARLMLIATALVAAHFSEAGGWRPSASLPLWPYLGAAVAAAVGFARRPAALVGLHLLDVAFAASLALTVNGPAGLFLAASTFCILAAAVRWSWRVVAATGAALAVSYGLGVGFGFLNPEQMVIRAAYLILTPASVCLAVWKCGQLRNSLLQVARWTNSRFAGESDGVLRVFRHAAAVLEAPEIVAFWRDHETQARNISIYQAGHDALHTVQSPHFPEDTVAPTLRERAFIYDRGHCLTHEGVEEVAGALSRL